MCKLAIINGVDWLVLLSLALSSIPWIYDDFLLEYRRHDLVSSKFGIDHWSQKGQLGSLIFHAK